MLLPLRYFLTLALLGLSFSSAFNDPIKINRDELLIPIDLRYAEADGKDEKFVYMFNRITSKTSLRQSVTAFCEEKSIEKPFCNILLEKSLQRANAMNWSSVDDDIAPQPRLIGADYCLKSIYQESDPSNLFSIFKSHDENIADKWQQYFQEYDEIFFHLKGQPIRLLEIGVQNGGSLQLWRKYFNNPDSRVHGIDIDDRVCKMAPLGRDIAVSCFNASDHQELQNFVNPVKDESPRMFDIIVDDGSHMNSDVINTFRYLFHYVTPGGFYIIEDTHTSYWRKYGGGFRNINTMMEYFKRLVDLMHVFHIEDPEVVAGGLSDFEIYCLQRVRKITFVDSMIVIEKSRYKRSMPFVRVISGIDGPVHKPLQSDLDQFKHNAAQMTDSAFVCDFE